MHGVSNKFDDELLAFFVVTLALGSHPKQGLAKVRAKSEAQESHSMLSRV